MSLHTSLSATTRVQVSFEQKLPLLCIADSTFSGNYAGEYGSNVLAPKGDPTANWNTGLN